MGYGLWGIFKRCFSKNQPDTSTIARRRIDIVIGFRSLQISQCSNPGFLFVYGSIAVPFNLLNHFARQNPNLFVHLNQISCSLLLNSIQQQKSNRLLDQMVDSFSKQDYTHQALMQLSQLKYQHFCCVSLQLILQTAEQKRLENFHFALCLNHYHTEDVEYKHSRCLNHGNLNHLPSKYKRKHRRPRCQIVIPLIRVWRYWARHCNLHPCQSQLVIRQRASHRAINNLELQFQPYFLLCSMQYCFSALVQKA